MSGDVIHVPAVPPGKIGMMIYRPYFSKKKGAWVPGAYPSHTSVYFCTKHELIQRYLSDPEIVTDKGKIPAISPGLLFDGSDRRANRNVQNLQFLKIDLDSGDLTDFEACCKKLIAAGLEFVAHASPSNGLPGKGFRARIVLFPSAPIPGHLARQAIKTVYEMFTSNAEGKIMADQSCTDSSRVYFSPACFAANRSEYFAYYQPGMELQVEDIYDRMNAVSTTVSMERSDVDRAATISHARAGLAPSARAFGRPDLEALAKNKKAGLSGPQRAALLAASKGERMVVVKGERDPAALKQSLTHGGDLEDENIDQFLTALMYKVAVYHRNADPDHVQRALAPSLSLTISEDGAAGNPSYQIDALRLKFESGVRAADEREVEDAKKAGLPTMVEFKAEQGIENDEGDLSSLLPGRVYLGARCMFMIRKGADGESVLRPVCNFTVIPRERLTAEAPDELKRHEVLYEVDFVYQAADGVRVVRRTLPPTVLMSKRSFNEYLGDIDPLSWRGTDDQAQSVRDLLLTYCIENNVPQKQMTYRLGMRADGALITPQGSFKWSGGYEVEPALDAPTFAPSHLFEANEKIRNETARRSMIIDIDALRTYATYFTRQLDPGVAWMVASHFGLGPLRDRLNQFPTLQIVGTKGSGKSSLARRAKEAFAGSEVSVGGMPRYSQAKELAGNCSFPVVFEEFRWRKGGRMHATRDNIRDLYTRQSISRAGFKTLRMESPLCVVGEHEVARGPDGTDGATMQRMLFARTETTMLQGPLAAARQEAYAHVAACPIEDSGHWLLYPCWAGAQYPKARLDVMIPQMRLEIDAHIKTLPTSTQGALDERTRYNLSLALLGVFVWFDWCQFLGADPGPLPTLTQLCKNTIETVTGSGSNVHEEQVDPLANYLETLSRVLAEVSGGNPNLGLSKWWLREGNILYIDVSASLQFYTKNGGSDDATYANQSAIYQFARESSFSHLHPSTNERHRKRIPGSSVSQSRCVALRIDALEAAEVSLSDAFLVDSSTPSAGGFNS